MNQIQILARPRGHRTRQWPFCSVANPAQKQSDKGACAEPSLGCAKTIWQSNCRQNQQHIHVLLVGCTICEQGKGQAPERKNVIYSEDAGISIRRDKHSGYSQRPYALS